MNVMQTIAKYSGTVNHKSIRFQEISTATKHICGHPICPSFFDVSHRKCHVLHHIAYTREGHMQGTRETKHNGNQSLVMTSSNGSNFLVAGHLCGEFTGDRICARINGWINNGKAGDSWWRHQMETFSALLALCAGNSPVPVNSPHKGQWRGALMFILTCTRINDWVNNREAGDLRRHRGHYDVNVMLRRHRAHYDVIVMWKALPVRLSFCGRYYIDGLVQDCNNSSALAMRLLQSCV